MFFLSALLVSHCCANTSAKGNRIPVLPHSFVPANLFLQGVLLALVICGKTDCIELPPMTAFYTEDLGSNPATNCFITSFGKLLDLSNGHRGCTPTDDMNRKMCVEPAI